MFDNNITLYYSIACFLVVFISGCAVNLLRQHFIIQLTGIAFFFSMTVVKVYILLKANPEASSKELYFGLLPLLSGISACMISMIIGFLLFPAIRKKFKG